MNAQVAKVRPLVAGNWKMNGLKASMEELIKVRDACSKLVDELQPGVLIAPPVTLLAAFAEATKGSNVVIAAQDCHVKVNGAHTGDLSAEMLADAGASAVIVGHSERRTDHGETDAIVRAKAEAAHRAGIGAIVCIGETAGERSAGLTLQVIRRQLDKSLPAQSQSANTVIAYEPVWAIGTGLTATPDDVAEVHAVIRAELVKRFGDDGQAMRILYGGSVKPDNAKSLFAVPNVNGALVGGASLKAADFLAIIAAAG